jgi:tRNA G10  N-methylase Trm11
VALELARLGYETLGIDLSKEMIEKARDNAEKINLDVEFRIGDVENIELLEDGTISYLHPESPQSPKQRLCLNRKRTG